MENYGVKQIFNYYRMTEGIHNEKYKKSLNEFENTLKKYIKNENECNELSEAALYIENVAAEQNFKAGYKCALQAVLVQIIKECDLL